MWLLSAWPLGLYAAPPPDHILSLPVNKDKEQDEGGSEDL